MTVLSVCYVSGLLGMLVGYHLGKFERWSIQPIDTMAYWLFIWGWPLLAGIIIVASILGLTRRLVRKVFVCMKSLKS